MAVLLEELLLHEGPARKDLAAYVSLSSDSLVKQPGTSGGPTLRKPGGVSKLYDPDLNRSHFTEYR